MFVKSAAFYNAIYRFKNYQTAAKQVQSLISQRHPSANTLLDVGCGTGQHLKYLRTSYQVEGLDISPELLAVARPAYAVRRYERFGNWQGRGR